MILQRINIYKYEIRYKNSKMKLNTIGILKIAAFGIPLYTFKEYMFLKIATQSISN